MSDGGNAASPRPGFVEELQTRLGYQFVSIGLLLHAVTHRSWCAEHDAPSNERLEFLGDSVLGLAVTNFIYRRFPDLPEGELAKLRASVVNAHALADAAHDVDLGAYLLLGKGEETTNGRSKASIVSDAFEAVIGAVYIDGGWEVAETVVLRLLESRIELYATGPGGSDYKTRLQELVAHRFESLPQYRVVGTGPDHEKVFDAEVLVLNAVRGRGTGRSKKQAEQVAAQQAWESLTAELGVTSLPHP